MDLHPDFKDLLAEFARFEVSYVLLGGYAVGYYAEPRATKDLDVLVSIRGDNRQRLTHALDTFGAPPNVTKAAAQLAPNEVVYMGVPPLRIDILVNADGIDTDEVIGRAKTITLGKLSVSLISRADLVTNKTASGRPQDLADVAALASQPASSP
ncbi:MAG: hypothetical protein AB8H86_13710 [Polyangiales bacterium]